jgi:hypothetical protein
MSPPADALAQGGGLSDWYRFLTLISAAQNEADALGGQISDVKYDGEHP